ncbi:hypothetical protein OTERR_21520 [Oryzomicrobium terrae]|uniref:Outer membrane protein n=1 Tax=Oryzomicrobium terrae TaxID=1735038 RepID=A0A5C1EBK8_9RHOO|nr:hypothetical protein OTERR_21520 [Oryzomicrobium terrae]
MPCRPPLNRRLLGRCLTVGALAAAVLALPASADQKPLWEAGIGVGALVLPDYRGSNQTRGYALPVPYFMYRGDFLRADRNGVRGALLDTDRVELNISVSASLPVNSDKNDARTGMSDLKPIVEVGPSLDINLWRTGDRRTKLDLRLPMRAALTVESNPKAVGWVFSPRLNLDVEDVAGFNGWNLGLLAGPIYQTRKFNEYFYSVAPQYATASRPTYQANGGYAGTQVLSSLSKRFKSTWVGAYVRWDSLKGAAFEDSPLVKRDQYVAAGVAIAWVLGESAQKVEWDY